MGMIGVRTLGLQAAMAAGMIALSISAARRGAEPAKPNIIFIMADDLGFADVGYRGSPIKTPNIDKLATEGVRMDAFYGMPVCTPARAELMTGRYPMRYGLQTLVIFPSHTYGLATDERTLPQALKDAGYTTLMTGKWHLGHADRKYWPQNRGFDYFYGNVVGEIDYFTHARGGVVDWQRNGKFLNEPGYFMDLIGDEAVRLIDQQDGNTPFFLYFASLAPHAPYQVTQKYKDLYPSVTDKNQQSYMGMISSLDDQVGRIVAELDKKHIRDNTIILFASDNGGATSGLFASGPESASGQKAHRRAALKQGEKAPRRTRRSAAAREACARAACACRPSSTGMDICSHARSPSRSRWST